MLSDLIRTHLRPYKPLLFAVLAVLVRRAVLSAGERRVDACLPALFVAAGSTLLTLVRPGITPDHPWADRRLLITLPLVVALVVTAAAWALRRSRAADRAWVGVVAAGVGVGIAPKVRSAPRSGSSRT